MQLTDLEVLRQLDRWLQAGSDAWLCSIVATYGSAPRPIGSLFATDGSQRTGSISGGCLEQAFFEKLQAGDFNSPAQLFDYDSQLNRAGLPSELPCGGRIKLLVEYLPASDANRGHIADCLRRAQEYCAFERRIDLNRGDRELVRLADCPHQPVVVEAASVSLCYSQLWQILILGVSQVGEHVARLGLMAGYSVRLCDNREEMAPAWNFGPEQGGIAVEWCDPGQFVEQYGSSTTAVLALAHDPRVDDVGLMSALRGPGFYLGAMGSQTTTAKRRERLQRIAGFSDTDIDRLHAPIGLDIGSKTPVEIAISIMAALTLEKSRIGD